MKRLLLALMIAGTSPAVAHDGWIEHQMDPVLGVGCCGDTDCPVVPFDDIVAVPGGYKYVPTGEIVEEKRAQWHPDGKPRVCQWIFKPGQGVVHDPTGPIKCLFIAGGGA